MCPRPENQQPPSSANDHEPQLDSQEKLTQKMPPGIDAFPVAVLGLGKQVESLIAQAESDNPNNGWKF
jgi:hypothetical protein